MPSPRNLTRQETAKSSPARLHSSGTLQTARRVYYAVLIQYTPRHSPQLLSSSNLHPVATFLAHANKDVLASLLRLRLSQVVSPTIRARKMTTLSTSKTNCQLHLLTTHTADSSPSLLVTFDQHKYLFNVPESFSRVCVQSKISLKKIGKVFVGDLSENVGGLPGLLLSTVESGNNDVEVVAGEGLEHLVASYRFYTRRCALSFLVPPPR